MLLRPTSPEATLCLASSVCFLCIEQQLGNEQPRRPARPLELPPPSSTSRSPHLSSTPSFLWISLLLDSPPSLFAYRTSPAAELKLPRPTFLVAVSDQRRHLDLASTPELAPPLEMLHPSPDPAGRPRRPKVQAVVPLLLPSPFCFFLLPLLTPDLSLWCAVNISRRRRPAPSSLFPLPPFFLSLHCPDRHGRPL